MHEEGGQQIHAEGVQGAGADGCHHVSPPPHLFCLYTFADTSTDQLVR